MLTLAEVSKSFGTRVLFEHISLFVKREDRFGLQRVDDERIGVDMAVGPVQLIEELNAADGNDKGMAETVVCRVFRVRTIGGADTVDDDIVVVRIGRIRWAVRVQAQRLVLEKPAFPQIGRDRRDSRLLLIARPVIEKALIHQPTGRANGK